MVIMFFLEKLSCVRERFKDFPKPVNLGLHVVGIFRWSVTGCVYVIELLGKNYDVIQWLYYTGTNMYYHDDTHSELLSLDLVDIFICM